MCLQSVLAHRTGKTEEEIMKAEVQKGLWMRGIALHVAHLGKAGREAGKEQRGVVLERRPSKPRVQGCKGQE